MLTYEEKRTFIKQIDKEVSDRAQKAELYYVICFYMSPITEHVEHRQAYFDDFTEAHSFMFNMKEKYKARKFYIASNLSMGDIDGGLL